MVMTRRRRRRPERFLPYLLLAPALVLLVGMVYPFGLGVYYSFTNYWLQYPKRFHFIWFDNYVNLVSEPLFTRALEFTLGFTVVTVVVQVGLGLAVAADFRVTCPEARFAANFTKLGFHPGFGLTTTLPELVGRNNAELIFYTSRRITGEDATRMGLANVCVPQDQVRAAAMKLAGEIAECSPLGLLSTRATMRAGLAERVMAATNHELAEQTRLRSTEDFKEGIKATEERRVADFKGR